MGNARYGYNDWVAVKKALSQGMTIRAVSAATGVSRNTVQLWSLKDRVPERTLFMHIDPTPPKSPVALRPSPKARLTPQERAWIAAMRDAGATQSQIAERIGVHRSTVSRELARLGSAPYDPRKAQTQAYDLAKRPKLRKVEANLKLRKEVVEKLSKFLSPREVSERLKVDFPDDPSMRISHEAIYQAIYVQGKGSLRQELAVEMALRTKRSRRKPQSKLPARPRGKTWVEGCEISTRPPEVEDRAVPGHWEGDLIVGSDLSSCLVTLVERKTRFLVVRKLETHDTKSVVDLLIEMAGSVPEGIRTAVLKTLTWDQGCEMADAARFTQATGFKVYFCDPHSPWQKGTNENTNGLIRQFFPKGTSFSDVTDEEVLEVQDLMNNRPRETLQWMTPAEVMNMELVKAGAMIA